jgi:DNA-binding winged helix-turn-helix (wHTH) protein
MRAAFGPFSFDLCALELSKNGLRLRLEEKPARLLACLIERRGEMVTREELCKRLWPDDVNLDFDHGLNKAMNKLRAALGDSAAEAKYLETLSKRGYRFIHAVELAPANEAALERISDSPPANASGGETETPELLTLLVPGPGPADRRQRLRTWLLLAASLASIVALVPAPGRLVHPTSVRPIGPKHITVPAGLRFITQGDGTLQHCPELMAEAGPSGLPTAIISASSQYLS